MKENKKPKILIALARMPYPATDGTKFKILHNVIDALKKDFDIEYLVISMEKIAEKDLNDFEKNYGKVHVFYISKLLFSLKILKRLFTSLPLQASGFMLTAVSKWLREEIKQYDIILVHTIRMTEYFMDPMYSKDKKIIIDFNDAISLNYQKSKFYANFPLNLIYTIEEKRIRAYEQKVLNTFSNFNIVSNNDKKYLLNILRNKEREKEIIFKAIPHGIENLSLTRNVGQPYNIYFIGQLDYEMNRSALEFFLSELWVEVTKATPGIQLYIIGKGGKNLYKKYSHMEGVHFTGYLPNQYEIITQCSCMIAPILSGAGMPTKIIEAMACGIPVITTPQGAQGILGTKHRENMIIISDKDRYEWVQAIHELLTVESVNHQLGNNAKRLFEEHYELSKVQALWLQFFLDIYKSD